MALEQRLDVSAPPDQTNSLNYRLDVEKIAGAVFWHLVAGKSRTRRNDRFRLKFASPSIDPIFCFRLVLNREPTDFSATPAQK